MFVYCPEKIWRILWIYENILFHQRTSYTDFAKSINYDKYYINAIALGKRKPGIKLAKIIQEATGGEVTVDELLGLKEED